MGGPGRCCGVGDRERSPREGLAGAVSRAIRVGDWKLVAPFRGAWELYDLRRDRAEGDDLAGKEPDRVKALAARWQKWADAVGVVPWERLPGGKYKPTARYRKKSEPAGP